jgi:hypothetical protein
VGSYRRTTSVYLSGHTKPGWTCGEFLDVLMGVDDVNAERHFERNTHACANAIAAFKRRKPGWHTWGEVLHVAALQAWWRRG